MFKPLEDCISAFIGSCATGGYPLVEVSNFRIEKEGDKLCIYFEADLNEGEAEEDNV